MAPHQSDRGARRHRDTPARPPGEAPGRAIPAHRPCHASRRRATDACVTDTHVLLWHLSGAGRNLARHARGFAQWIARLRAHPGYEVVALTVEVILRSSELMFAPGRTDRLIAATALEHHVPLITRHPELHAVGVEVVWT